jgi:hypothetical protein
VKGLNLIFVLGLLIMPFAAKLVVHFSDFDPPTFFWPISSFIIIVSLISYFLLTIIGGNDSDNFIRFVLASMVLKLLIYIIFIAIVIYLDIENANSNVVLFLSLYLSYSLFEVGIIFKKMSK